MNRHLKKRISRVTNQFPFNSQFVTNIPEGPTLGRKGKPNYSPKGARHALSKSHELAGPCRIPLAMKDVPHPGPHESRQWASEENMIAVL
jgi:hypothetical protein